MTYNIHPLFVHFPIALLFVYSVIKILPLHKWLPSVSWKDIERALLFCGVLGAFAALSTGELAEHMTRPNHDIVEAHAFFSVAATWMYGLLLAGEVVSVALPWLVRTVKVPSVIKGATILKNILTHHTLSIILAVFGLIALSISGLLGGVMVYGTSADPLAGIVLKMLGISF